MQMRLCSKRNLFCPCLGCAAVFLRNSSGQQRERLRLFDQGAKLVEEGVLSGNLGNQDDPRLGAELARPEREGTEQTLRQGRAPLRKAPGRTKTGLPLDISVKQGIGSGRAAARSISARPACRDPVNATARTSGCFTSAVPTSMPESNSMVKTPGCRSCCRNSLGRIWPAKSRSYPDAPGEL